jgi:hypothetical protein
MSYTARRYIFRFIHWRTEDGWSVLDTLSGTTHGTFPSEDTAMAAALAATRRHSAWRRPDNAGQPIPLL